MATGNILAQGNIDKFCVITQTIDIANIAANTTGATFVTIPGVRIGDLVFATHQTTTFSVGLVQAQCVVTANDTINMRVANVTVGALDNGAITFLFFIIRTDAVLTGTGW